MNKMFWNMKNHKLKPKMMKKKVYLVKGRKKNRKVKKVTCPRSKAFIWK